MASDVKWIKITTDIFDDEKILLIESMPDAYAIITVWFKLLCLAGKMNNSGVFVMNGRIPYTDTMLATVFRMKESTVQLALKTFEQFGMVELIDGVITIPNWDKHQTLDAYEKKKARDRLYQAERRANQKALIKKSSDKSSDVAISEEDIEEEKEKELDSSIYLSCEKNVSEMSVNVEKPVDKSRSERTYLGGELGKGFVFISQEQIDDLLDILSIDEFDHYVAVVADCERKGKHFSKSHYQAILDMAEADRRKGRKAK